MDTILGPLMDDLRACVCTALADTIGGGVECSCALVPGTLVVADHCSCSGRDKCGQAWVRVVRLYPSGTRFPAQDQDIKTSCAAVLAAVLEVGVYRCQPVGSTSGAGGQKRYTPPSAADLTQAALVQADDTLALHRAILCCEAIQKRPNLLGNYTPAASGDCGGGSWQVTVSLIRR